MGTFSNLILTDLGLDLKGKIEVGETTATLNRFGLGTGIIANDAEARTLTDLKERQMWIDPSRFERNKTTIGKVIASGYMTPENLPAVGFTLYEIGLYFQDPDLGEILYGVMYAAPGEGDFIPALGTQAFDYALNVNIALSDTANITIYYDAAGSATRQELLDHAALVIDPSQTGNEKKHLTEAQANKWETHVDDAGIHRGYQPGDEIMLPYEPTAQQMFDRRMLERNGASLLRTDYPDLFAVIGTMYGAVDANHFSLPDDRGQFLRIWDHSAGIDPDRVIGSMQNDENKSHRHEIRVASSETPLVQSNIYARMMAAPSFSIQSKFSGGIEARPKNRSKWGGIFY